MTEIDTLNNDWIKNACLSKEKNYDVMIPGTFNLAPTQHPTEWTA